MNLPKILFLALLFCTCTNENKPPQEIKTPSQPEVIKTETYELIKSGKKAKAVLVLFGGFPENPEQIKREFKILDIAQENNIDVLLMNYNRKLWLEENEKLELAKLLQSIFITNKLQTDNIHIGGFSSGGNISLLISDFIFSRKEFYINPKGVFIIDSPVDLLELYNCAKNNVKRNFSAPSVQESKRQISMLEQQCGNPNLGISKYENYSIYTLKTNNLTNVSHLKNCKIRLYTEPDTTWWKENRMNDYEDMNTFAIKHLAEAMQKEFGKSKIEYIPTVNKGYRSNGMRHPHSWSIVDIEDLVEWINPIKEK